MKKFITLASVLIVLRFSFAQVGIGTETPQAMLDVAGTLMVQDSATMLGPLKLEYIEDLSITEFSGNEIVLVADLADQKIVKRVNLDNLSTGMSVYNQNQPNKSLYSAKIASGLTLLSIGIFNTWQPIIFPPQSKVVGNNGVVDSNGIYTVPSDGVYSINFQVRLGNGIEASLLTGSPMIGILKRNSAGTFSVLDLKTFPGLSVVGVVNLTIAELSLNALHQLNQGDKLYFALVRGGITLSLLGSGSASYQVYKVSGKIQ